MLAAIFAILASGLFPLSHSGMVELSEQVRVFACWLVRLPTQNGYLKQVVRRQVLLGAVLRIR